MASDSHSNGADDPSDDAPAAAPAEEEIVPVCPGCYAVGNERCDPDCVELRLFRDALWGSDEHGGSDEDDRDNRAEDNRAEDDRDESLQRRAELEECPDAEPPESGRALPLTGALIELARAERRLDELGDLEPRIRALEAELTRSSGYEGAHCCRWCRELVLDDFDHDFCEPDEPTEPLLQLDDALEAEAARAFADPEGLVDETGQTIVFPFPVQAAPGVGNQWSDQVLCPGCPAWLDFELTAEPALLALSRRYLSTARTTCKACGSSVTLCFDWSTHCITAMKFEKSRPTPPVAPTPPVSRRGPHTLH